MVQYLFYKFVFSSSTTHIQWIGTVRNLFKFFFFIFIFTDLSYFIFYISTADVYIIYLFII